MAPLPRPLRAGALRRRPCGRARGGRRARAAPGGGAGDGGDAPARPARRPGAGPPLRLEAGGRVRVTLLGARTNLCDGDLVLLAPPLAGTPVPGGPNAGLPPGARRLWASYLRHLGESTELGPYPAGTELLLGIVPASVCASGRPAALGRPLRSHRRSRRPGCGRCGGRTVRRPPGVTTTTWWCAWRRSLPAPDSPTEC